MPILVEQQHSLELIAKLCRETVVSKIISQFDLQRDVTEVPSRSALIEIISLYLFRVFSPRFLLSKTMICGLWQKCNVLGLPSHSCERQQHDRTTTLFALTQKEPRKGSTLSASIVNSSSAVM